MHGPDTETAQRVLAEKRIDTFAALLRLLTDAWVDLLATPPRSERTDEVQGRLEREFGEFCAERNRLMSVIDLVSPSLHDRVGQFVHEFGQTIAPRFSPYEDEDPTARQVRAADAVNGLRALMREHLGTE